LGWLAQLIAGALPGRQGSTAKPGQYNVLSQVYAEEKALSLLLERGVYYCKDCRAYHFNSGRMKFFSRLLGLSERDLPD